jgi:hypothetical protein
MLNLSDITSNFCIINKHVIVDLLTYLLTYFLTFSMVHDIL